MQQQTVTVEEVEDDKPLSYVKGTPQPLTEVPAFPGHYQIEFPGEQIEGEMNSDVYEIEEIEPFPIPPRDTRPSGFAMPPPPRRFTPLLLDNLLHHHLHVHNSFQSLAFKAG